MKLVVLALALFASSADAANSEDISYMCATPSSFVPTATASAIGGACSTTTLVTDLYTYDITACSTTDVSSTYTLSEAAYTRALSADCCGGTAGACDLDDNTVCETPANYDEDATTDISGCTAGSSGCSDNGYWTCSLLVQTLFNENVADDLSTCPTTTSSYTNLNNGKAITQAEAIQMVGHYCCTDGISTCGAADESLLPGSGDDDDDICFSGDSTVQLASGATKTMADLEVGDSVLSADATGKLSYSAVAFKPHAANAKAATFVKVTTESGKAVTATPTHLLASCEGGLVQAKAASCLKTVNGDEAVTSVETFKGKGIYSAVTLDNEFLVVDGVVASPFAMAHGLVNAYYNLHRAVYKNYPSLLKMPAVVSMNSLLAAGAIFAMNAVTASEK